MRIDSRFCLEQAVDILQVYNLFKHAQSEGYAIPAINVTSSSTVVASLEAARDAKSPIILVC